MAGALEDLLVLDFSTLLPGPMASLLLAEAGAEVVKVERPGTGDEMRGYPPRWGADGVNFALLNRGKRSLELDLKDAGDRARLEPLLARADILVEQFRPGVMARLGLGYDSVSAVNPGIVYCSITGYGQTGPRRAAAGHDLNYLGDTGLLSLSMGDAGTPVVPPALIADIAGGAYPAFMNILLALRARERGGGGAHLDIAMADNLFPMMYWALGSGLGCGAWPAPGGELVTGGSPRYRLYPTADGRFVAAAPLEDRFWAAFADAVGLEDELRGADAAPAETARRVAEIVAARPAAHWERALADADCCATVVRTLEEALADPHFRERGLFDAELVNAEGGSMPALPVPVDRALRGSAAGARPAPALGADNAVL